MKRDMDLVRKILLALKEYEHGNAPDFLEIEGYTEEQIGYHCFIMGEAGLIIAVDTTTISSESPSAIPSRLTWGGYEFIDKAADEKVWSQTKEVISKLGDVSFSVCSSVLSKIVLHNLGL